MSKVKWEDVDQAMEEYEAEDMGDPGVPDELILEGRMKIASLEGIDVSRVRISWCGPVDEFCIYVDGRWCGYWEWKQIPFSQWEFDAENEYFSK